MRRPSAWGESNRGNAVLPLPHMQVEYMRWLKQVSEFVGGK